MHASVQRSMLAVAVASVFVAAPVAAQRDTMRPLVRAQLRQQLPPQQGRGAGRAGRAALAPGQVPPQRLVRQAFNNAVRRQLNLDQPKMRRLNQTEQQFDQQRRQVSQGERQTRLALRAAMEDTTGRDRDKIDGYISQLVQAQRKKVDIAEAEQKELSSFLTPTQRAQYLSLKERLNKRLGELTQGGRGAAPDGPPPGPPPAEH
ncbi:MAG: hypothetical protein ACREPM_08975 [Gemmatimonadaceae bacterium]